MKGTDMPPDSTCQPWCEKHNDAAAECLTLRCLYSHDEDPPPRDQPEAVTLPAQFRALSGFPARIDTILVEVSYVPAEEERPEMVLRFRDIAKDHDSAVLGTTLAGLKELHSNLGGFIQELERPG